MKMVSPASGTFTTADGTSFTPAPDGSVDAPIQYVAQLGAMGFVPAPNADVDTTGGRPVTSLKAGLMWFDSTIGKPIWWNGSGWQDAAGNAV